MIRSNAKRTATAMPVITMPVIMSGGSGKKANPAPSRNKKALSKRLSTIG